MQFTKLILCSFRDKIPKVQNHFKKILPGNAVHESNSLFIQI